MDLIGFIHRQNTRANQHTASIGQVPGPSGTVSVNTPAAYPSTGLVNYIRAWSALQPIASDTALSNSTNPNQITISTQYLDGLGRPVQSVEWQASPTGNDIVSPVLYDSIGREQFKYLPYLSSSSDGSFQFNPFGNQNSFYTSTYPSDQPALTGEQYFYNHTDFERSPLNRVLKAFAPGNSWAGSEGGTSEKSVQNLYLINDSADAVLIWTINFNALTYIDGDITTNIPTTSSSTIYSPGTLYKNVTIDEAGHAVVSYTDLQGQVILKKVQIESSIPSDYSGCTGFLCTYYIYDTLNQLRFVIPPKATNIISGQSWILDSTTIKELCFRYEYDYRRRMIAKKVPGSAWTYMVYDMTDQLVFSQDGNMSNNNQWLGVLHDALNRPIETGMLSYSNGQASLQSYVSANTSSGTITTQTINGNAPSTIPPNPVYTQRQEGITSYEATNSITFNPGFTTESTASFVAQIVSANGQSFSSNVMVINNPVPSGSNFIALTITNYDNYSNTAKTYSTSNNSKLTKGTNPYSDTLPTSASVMVRGFVTSTQVRVIENPSNLSLGQWLETAIFYDDKGREVQIQSSNYRGGLDIGTILYDFVNKSVCTYKVHNDSSAGISNLRFMTNMNYDRLGRLLTITKNINDDSSASSPQTTQRTLATNIYDALGQLKEKKIGQTTAYNSAPSSNPLEDDSYAYNIRGWLKGINWQGYGGSSTSPNVSSQSNKWFGMDLSYDWGYNSNQFNGNIAGMQWASASDNAQRSYGFGYDNGNRLLFGDFNQNFGGSWSKTDPSASGGFTIDFSIRMGDGVNYSSAYDPNGNILSMKQMALVVNASQLIDSLTYNYTTNSNKLSSVSDAATEPLNMNLGDFVDRNTSGPDYGYDLNGNLITDKNRSINGSIGIDQTSGGGITYNHLNLPYQLTVLNTNGSTKGTITYIYDASGRKLEKRVSEAPDSSDNNIQVNTTTDYIDQFVYQNNSLQFFGHEEGRVRVVTANTYNNNLTYVYDYFLKDHLGNTRTVLTDELEQDIYPAATVESASDQIENAYYNINTANIVSNPPTLTSPTNQSYPNNNGIPNPDSSINTSAISSYMYKISPSTNGGTNTGLGITIKVMTGDNITIFGKSFWHNNNPSIQNTGYNQVAATLLTLLAGAPAVASTTQGITPSLLTNSSTISTDLSSWLANEPQPMTKPKAFINWVLFDEQFRPDTSNGSSGVDAVDDTADVLKPQMDNVTITKSGYLYIYCSNESNIDVFFDNLQVVDTRGPLLETGSYYPFGLTMAGISDKAVKSQYAENKYRFNKGTELQNKEFSDGTGLELYETNFRSLDPQLGRFWQMDPLAQTLPSFSPYQFADDNPIFFNDPLGLLSDSAHPQDLKPVTVTAHRKTDNTSAWGLGWEWLTGTGAREHHFKDGDPFTKMLQKHEHIQDTRDKIVNGLANHTIKLKNPYTNNYALGGLSGVPKYLRDYSTLMTGGLTGNIAVTFLGSYGLKYEVLSIDEQSGTAQVHFHMDNASTIESATHPPVIGYTQWWSNNIGKPLNDFFSSGAMSKTVQTADWTETIQWKGDK